MDYEEDSIDVTKLRYVLYARKSTDDPMRQVRSIPDQIAECTNLAQRLGLNIADVRQETKSAKKPNQRPIFKQILTDLRNRKYDGILAWHPDRLARNMREGGEVIDMIDEKQILDLKFVTHHFTPDANGKMLLGMSFVLSKQYSDDLSQKVTRGVRRGLAEGKSSGTPKHGYVRTSTGLYEPDGNNFELIKQAWEMRTKGEHLEPIAEFLNDHGYSRLFKENAKKAGGKLMMNKKILSKMFRDSFYYGVLVQNGKPVDLRTIYDFKAAVSEEAWNAVQQLSNRRLKPSEKRRSAFLPLRHIVTCSYCKRNMVVGAAGGRSKRYLTYRCDNKLCPRGELGVSKGMRGNVVFNFVDDFLAEGLNFTRKEYDQYNSDLMKHLESRRGELQAKLLSKQGALKATASEVKDLALQVAKLNEDDPTRKYALERVVELEQQKALLEDDIKKIKQQLENPDKEKLSVDQFLNLSKNAAAKVKAGDAVAKDEILRFIFLNLQVGDQKVASYSLKEPFATLLKNRQVSLGRGDRT